MSLNANTRTVAEFQSAKVSAAPAADGALVSIEVTFRLIEWPGWEEDSPLSLLPQHAEVSARTARGQVNLGYAAPAPGNVLIPPVQSGTGVIRYTLPVTMRGLAAIENARDGGDLTFVLVIGAHPIWNGDAAFSAADHVAVTVPREDWLAVLERAAFQETLITELPLPMAGPSDTQEARKRLVGAMQARAHGSYAEALRRCRIAIDELKKKGFGGKSRKEVTQFLKQNAGTLTPEERFSALQSAMELLLAPAHHANAPEDHYAREDADLAIAMTAALLKLAPRWSPAPAKPKAKRPRKAKTPSTSGPGK